MPRILHTREELILVADLYFRRGSNLHVASPEVVELSDTLRAMDVYPENELPMPDSFRSPSSVQQKTKGFQYFDPDVPGGLYNSGKLTGQIFLEFRNDREHLHSLAELIRQRVAKGGELKMRPRDDPTRRPVSPSPANQPDLRAGKAIPLDELRDACAEYDRRCEKDVDFNKWLKVFRDDVGIDMDHDASQLSLDLENPEHCDNLILLPNRWLTHVPSRNREHYRNTVERLGTWWRRLDENPLPTPATRLTDPELSLAQYEDVFDSLRAIQVNDRQTFSHVAASKTLYFARAHVFVAWDKGIRAALRHRDRSGATYRKFLESVRGTLLAIRDTYKTREYDLDELPGEIGQTGCTAPEVINKFYWVKTHPETF